MSESASELIDEHVLDRLANALGDRDLVREALDGWLAALPSRLEAIRQAAEQRHDVSPAAQRLESPSAALGLAAVAAACRALADAGVTAAADLLERLDVATASTRRAIGPWR